MTPVTQSSFAYRLFHAIRNNKKGLIAEQPALSLSDSPGYEQREALRRLINAMFLFEKQCRGDQKALADFDAHPEFGEHRARQLVKMMLDCQSSLFGSVWQEIMGIEGLSVSSFETVAHEHIRYDRLPGVVSVFPGFKATFERPFTLKMTFTNGAAVRTLDERFHVPSLEGISLEVQIVRLNSYWLQVKHFAREAAKSPANWPSLFDSENTEKAQVAKLLKNMFRGISDEQTALLRKHRSEVSNFLDML